MELKSINATIDFDIFDVDNAENFEKAIDEMSLSEEKIQAAQNLKKMSAINKAMLEMFQTFFKTATGTDVLKDCRNMMTAQNAYLEFVEIVGEAETQIVTKYDPKRAMR